MQYYVWQTCVCWYLVVYKRIKNKKANNLKFPVSNKFETNFPQKVSPFIKWVYKHVIIKKYTFTIFVFSSLFNIILIDVTTLFVGLLKSARLFLLLLDEKRSDPLSDTKALKDGLQLDTVWYLSSRPHLCFPQLRLK